jgi:hypothetical protein
LRVPEGALDLQLFETLAREAARAEPEQAARLLRKALALWRGPPLAGLREPFARWEAARLEGMRTSALDAEQAGGHQAECDQFMLSLYRAARNLNEARRSGRYLLAVALVDAGLLALRKGETRDARAALMGALVVADAIGNPIARSRGLMALAAVELAEQDAVRGATLLGAADAIRKSIGHTPPAGDAARQKELVAAGTRALGDAGFTQAWRHGQTLSTRAAIAFALD